MADMTALLEDRTSDTTQTADGTVDTDARQVASFYQFNGYPQLTTQELTVIAAGTFNSAAIELEIAPTQSGPWVANSDVQFTAAGSQVTPISPRAWVRAKVSGSGSPAPSLSIYVG